MLSQLQRTFDGVTYDVFIGRGTFEDGEEHFHTLDLANSGFCGYMTLEEACRQLFNQVKAGKKVLLTKSPGEIGSRQENVDDAYRAISDAIEVASKEFNRPKPLVPIVRGGETFILQGVRYDPFKPEQMARLSAMYAQNEGVQNFPDPFQNQPR